MYQSRQNEVRASVSPRLHPSVETVVRPGGGEEPTRRGGPPLALMITPQATLRWVLRFWYLAVAVTVLGGLVGIAAGTLIKPRFTSYSDMLLDPSTLQVMADDLYSRNIQGDAQLLDVESKMRVLTSTNVLTRVVQELGLENNPDLMEPEFPALASSASAGAQDPLAAAVRALSERVQVRREERSYVVTASVWARSPEQSAILTNALVAAFLAEQSAAEADGALQASAALNERLDQLRDDAAAAEAAVAEYRRSRGLQMSGNEQLSTQSAVQLNTQISAAREAFIAAEASYANLTASSGDGRLNAAAQQSDVLNNLRTQYAAARQQADSLAATLGPRHPNLASAQSQLASLQAEIDREIARVVRTAETNLNQARAVFEQLTQAADTQMGAVFTDETAQVELRQLERAAASKVAIYEAYLTRAQEITQRSQISTSNVRVISTAVAPIARSYPPRTVLLAGMGLFGGLALGLGLAALAGLIRDVGRQRRAHAAAR